MANRSQTPKLAEFLSKLKNVREDSNGWNALCPAHEDNKNSLNIAISDDGKTLINCKAQCSTPQVVYAVGLAMTDMFPERYGESKTKRKKHGKVIEEYSYHDSEGALRFQVCRMDPKDFRQRRPDGKGDWIWNLQGVAKIPYRLPELATADKSQTVFIAEGEKDVERLRELGFIATCNPGGAGKWQKSFSKHLDGRSVVLLQDNDSAGQSHVADTGEKLQGFAASIKSILLPGLPPHGDTSDWLDAGGTIEQLLAIVASAEEGVPEKPPEPQRKKYDPSELDTICNAIKDEDQTIPVSMESIVGKIREITGDWPRRIGNDLFYDDREHGIHWLDKTAALFAMLGSKREPPVFHKRGDCHTKEEVFAELRRMATKYDSFEEFPHEPMRKECYYTCESPEPGDGKALQELVSRFSPETEHDAELIKAMFATTIWGGSGGTRPAFVITSDQGRGTGKSKMAAMVGYLTGGIIELSANEDASVVKQRLLSPEGLSRRVALLDNVKTLRFSWAELESLITATVISGKKMYVGESSRPNTLTWVITLNGISLSTDMSQRAVVIKISRPTHSGDWEEATRTFIDQNRPAIIADIVAFLRQPETTLRKFSRWGHWEQRVLSKLRNPSVIQEVIAERQDDSDVEKDDAELIEEFFKTAIDSLGYYPDERVHIPSAVVAKWVYRATGDKHGTAAIGRMLSQKIKEGSVTMIEKNPSKRFGRGFVFGVKHDENQNQIIYDLESRIEANNKKELM
jgi:hypothetical protein